MTALDSARPVTPAVEPARAATPAAKPAAPARTPAPAAKTTSARRESSPPPVVLGPPPTAPVAALQQTAGGGEALHRSPGEPRLPGRRPPRGVARFSEISGLNMVIDPDVQGTVDIILNECRGIRRWTSSCAAISSTTPWTAQSSASPGSTRCARSRIRDRRSPSRRPTQARSPSARSRSVTRERPRWRRSSRKPRSRRAATCRSTIAPTRSSSRICPGSWTPCPRSSRRSIAPSRRSRSKRASCRPHAILRAR